VAEIQNVTIRNNIMWNPTRVENHWHGTDSCANRKVSFSNNAVASLIGHPPTIALFYIADNQVCGKVATQYFYGPQGPPIENQALQSSLTSSTQTYPYAPADWLITAEATLSISTP
jgi:hypothetical protein